MTPTDRSGRRDARSTNKAQSSMAKSYKLKVRARPKLIRSSKSAAGIKISAWANQLKPARRASTIFDRAVTQTDHIANAEDPEAEYEDTSDGSSDAEKASESDVSEEEPLNLIPKRKKAVSSSPLSDPQIEAKRFPSIPKNGRRKRRITTDSHRRVSYPTPLVTKPSLRRFSVPVTTAPSTPRRSSRRTSGTALSTTTPEPHIVPQQQEHAFYFRMPENQHYKVRKPTRITDVDTITDPDAIKYPVEIPTGERGVYHEYCSAEELRELLTEIRGQPLSEIKTLIEAKVEDLVEIVAGIDPDIGQRLQSADEEELERLRAQFVESIKRAQEVYLDGLKGLGSDRGTVNRQGYVDLTIGYVDIDSNDD